MAAWGDSGGHGLYTNLHSWILKALMEAVAELRVMAAVEVGVALPDRPRYNGSVHEMGVALEIHRACRARLEAHGPTRLDRVKVAIGELSAVEPEILRYAWEAVVSDGPDADAELEIEWRPARQVCEDCGEIEERIDGGWLRLCPRCELPLRVEGGRELDLLQFAFTPLLDVPHAETDEPDDEGDPPVPLAPDESLP